jgi:hypothetical protein
MADIFCNFTIPAGTTGGKLSGGFTQSDGTPLLPTAQPPVLIGPGALRLTVTYPGTTGAPNKMRGIFVFSAAIKAPHQAKASPFVDEQGRTRCLVKALADKVVANGNSVYTFAPISYSAGNIGAYELTFVAANTEATPQIQWAEDPEFDTGN